MARSDALERGSWRGRAGPILLVLAAGLSAALSGRDLGLAAPSLATGATSRARSWHVMVADRAEPALYAPRGIAVDGQGRVYVLDQGDHRVKVFSSHGKVRAVWGTDTAGPLHLQDPDAIALDRQGVVYVADSGILKLSPTGRVLARWGGHGEPPNPVGLAVGGRGNLFLLIRGTWGTNGGCGTTRVIKLSSRGQILATWDVNAPGADAHTCPGAITVDVQGNFFVSAVVSSGCQIHGGCAHEDLLVRKFSPTGKLSATWMQTRREFPQSMALGADPSGNVYLLDGSALLKLSPTLKPLATWNAAASCPPRANWSGSPAALAVDAGGTIYVTDMEYVSDSANSTSPTAGVIQLISPAGLPRTEWGGCPAPLAATVPREVDGLSTDRQGNLYLISGQTQIKKLSPTGHPLAEWGSLGAGPGQFQYITAIAVDEAGNIYAADPGNHRIVKLSPSGQLLAQWISPPPPPVHNVQQDGLFDFVKSMAVDRHSAVYVVDGNRSRVLKLSPSGVVVARWGPRIGNILVSQPSGVVVDGRSNVYLAGDFYRRNPAGPATEECVEKLSPTGASLASWGRRQFGLAPWQTGSGCGGQIAVDSRGNVYTEFIGVAATSATGKPLGRWDVAGQAPGQFSGLTSIAIDARDNLYAADPGNYRIQKLSVAR